MRRQKLSKIVLIDEPGMKLLMFSTCTYNQHKTTSIGETWSHYGTNWRLPLAVNVTLNPFTSSSTFTRHAVPTLHSKLDNRTPTEPGTVSLSGDLKWVVPLVSVIPKPRRWTKRKFISAVWGLDHKCIRKSFWWATSFSKLPKMRMPEFHRGLLNDNRARRRRSSF